MSSHKRCEHCWRDRTCNRPIDDDTLLVCVCVRAVQILMGCAASELVQSGTCPNFIQIFGVFRGDGAPVESVWGSAANKAPNGVHPPQDVITGKAPIVSISKAVSKKASGKGKRGAVKTVCEPHLYIAMELCDRGCVEDMLRIIDADGIAAVDVGVALVLPYMYQMAVSMYYTSARLNMLHGDIKLLNFMLTHNPAGEVM